MGDREGDENKEHGMIDNEQCQQRGSVEDKENSWNHQYKYSSKIQLTQEVCYDTNIAAQLNEFIRKAE